MSNKSINLNQQELAQNPSITEDYLIEVAKGTIEGASIINKFGQNIAVGTTLVPVTSIGAYNTPQVAGATTLRIKAGGDANDTAAGTGAREITLVGLDETGSILIEALVTAGASASAVTTGTFMRLYTMSVSESGSYANASTSSHAALITVENGAGGTDWGTIDVVDTFAGSRSNIASYSVPLGFTAYMFKWDVSIESTKTVDLLFFKRENILETSAPYTSMQMLFEVAALSDTRDEHTPAPLRFPALTDIGFMAKVSTTGTAKVVANFSLLLLQD